jgi:hypothetical protein
VDGAHGREGPLGSEIAMKSGHGDEENAVQPNDALKVMPAPDEDLQQDIPENQTAQWTGTRSGGENPPPSAKVH